MHQTYRRTPTPKCDFNKHLWIADSGKIVLENYPATAFFLQINRKKQYKITFTTDVTEVLNKILC